MLDSNLLGVDEIDESISHIALVLKVDSQIQKVVLSFMCRVDVIDEHLLCKKNPAISTTLFRH